MYVSYRLKEEDGGDTFPSQLPGKPGTASVGTASMGVASLGAASMGTPAAREYRAGMKHFSTDWQFGVAEMEELPESPDLKPTMVTPSGSMQSPEAEKLTAEAKKYEDMSAVIKE